MFIGSSKKSLHAVTLSTTVLLSACINLGGALQLNVQTNVDPPREMPIALACGATANGASLTRTKFQAESVAYGEHCISETQSARCTNGGLGEFSGSYLFDSCVVSSPPVIPPTSRIAMPTGLSPANGVQVAATTSVKISWNAVNGARGYLVRAERLVSTGVAVAIIPQNNSYQPTTFDLPVAPGNSYRFWVHAYDQNFNTSSGYIPANYSEPAQTEFSVQAASITPGSCGTLANGASTSRTMYQASSVATGQACVSEAQTATCNNGALSAFSGTFTNGNCYVESPPQPPVAGSSCVSGTASSITQFGITWTFNSTRPCGNYANGDYYVVGPVTITRITPDSTTDANGWTINGTMVNPMPSPDLMSAGQGFDSSVAKYAWYNSALNLAPGNTHSPLVVAVNSSVVSSISVGAPNVTTSHSQVQAQAVLTVVPIAPAPGSFRPPMAGLDKTHRWNKSQLRYGILKKLAPVATTPSLDAVESYFEKPWQAMYEGNQEQSMSPVENMPGYGRDQAHQVSAALLSLHLNYSDAQKEKLYIRVVQYGIDIYGSLKAAAALNAAIEAKYKPTMFRGSGGLNNGRKAPMVFAGLALNDSNILEYADASKHMIFAEDKQTWYVTQADVGRVMAYDAGRPHETYTQSMVGTPEWRVDEDFAYGASNWSSAYYRWVGGAQVGNVLALRLTTGGVAAWNYPPLFDYEDRYWSIESPNGQKNQSWSAPNCIPPFAFDMWKAYR